MVVESVPAALQWPKALTQKYSPTQILGKGGFGCVYMAKELRESGNPTYVAIKVVGTDGYAKRESSILSELTEYSHPNIVKLFGCYEPSSGESAKTCLVISLARGPTLRYILEKGGALSLNMGKTISRQLLSAVAFLHGHAVIHRDIQPSNIIISGSSIDDDLWWSDEFDEAGKVLGYIKRCHITVIDFGFARALSPDDLSTDVGLDKTAKESEMEMSSQADSLQVNDSDISVNDMLLDPSVHKPEKSRGRSPTRDKNEIDASKSRKHVRDLSALGTRNYAAPEIMAGLRRVSSVMKMDSSFRSNGNAETKRSLAPCVSSYGMVADAFSVGATIRYMLTGVPPQHEVDSYIVSKNNPLRIIIRALKKRSRKNLKRIKQYKSSDELPIDAKDLIRKLTHYDSRKRATVRHAASSPWILSDVSFSMKSQQNLSLPLLKHGGPIEYLKCGTMSNYATNDDDSV